MNTKLTKVTKDTKNSSNGGVHTHKSLLFFVSFVSFVPFVLKTAAGAPANHRRSGSIPQPVKTMGYWRAHDTAIVFAA